MKHYIKFFLLFLVSLSICAAQKPATKSPFLWAGIYGDMSLLLHNVDFRAIPGCPTCGQNFSNTVGQGYSVGALVELPLAMQWRLRLRGGYADIGTRLATQEQNIGNTLVRRASAPNEVVTVPVATEYSLEAGLAGWTIEPGVSYEPVSRLFVSAGIGATFLSTTTFAQRESIISPAGVLFSTGRSFRNDTSGIIPNVPSALFNGTIGVHYGFPLSSTVTASPEVRLVLPFNNISSDLSWTIAQLQLGVTLTYSFIPPPDIIIKYDTTIVRDTTKKFVLNLAQPQVSLLAINRDMRTETMDYTEYRHLTIREHYLHEIPKISRLESSIVAFGIDPQGKREATPTIRIEEIETEEQFPLLPQVFFPEGNAELDNTAMVQLSKDGVRQFSENTLGRNTLDIYGQLLNIIGSRLTKKPEATITITGANNGKNSDTIENISRNRANAVKEYLIEKWNIAPSRINTAFRKLPDKAANNTTPDGQAENSRADINSNDMDILRPVSLREVIVKATPPIVEIVPTIVSDSGLVQWTVDVEQSLRPLRNFNGTSMPLGILQWNLAEKPMPELETPVQIELKAQDKIGMTTTARQSLKVQQLTLKKKRYELHDDKKIERFALIVFDFNSASLNPANQRIVDDIKSRIQQDSKVIISGFADRSGELTYNQNLALRRCQEVKNALGLAEGQVQLDPVGSKELLYDNESPQGRSYSRTVQIMVETPVRE